MLRFLKNQIFSDRARPRRMVRGPFRGAFVVMNPTNSTRKMLGLYEHELNAWLNKALPRVTRVLDVGANDGYFTLGCAAAFRRLGKVGEIVAFEPQLQHAQTLRQSITQKTVWGTQVRVFETLVGGEIGPGMTMLDTVRWSAGDSDSRDHTLLKIDVEGAELDVLNGAKSWLKQSNRFVIEVHQESFLEQIVGVFAARGLKLAKIEQQPMRLLGRKLRSKENWWLVSDN